MNQNKIEEICLWETVETICRLYHVVVKLQ